MAEATPSKFSLSATVAGSKRSADAAASPAKALRKVPKVSEMKMMEKAPVATRATTSAPVVICVYKVSDNAGDLWAMYKDSNTKLWQVQIEHDARPSISVSIVRQFDEYLKDNAKTTPGMPDSVQKLQQEAGIKLVLTNTEDPDSIGTFVQYRAAFYVAGEMESVVNFFLLLDGYFNFKARQLARATPFEVRVHPHLEINLDSLKEQMSYATIAFHEPTNDLPLKVFEAHPVNSKRVITLYFEPEDEATVSMVIVGNTWNYRDDLEKNGVPGCRPQDGGAYYRYLKQVDITDSVGKQQILCLVDIFNKQALRVVVDPAPEPEGAVAHCFDELRKLPCLHFA